MFRRWYNSRMNSDILKDAADEAIDLTGTVPVKVAAEYLRLTPRRVRIFLNPDCNCVIRQRRRRVKPKRDPDCPICHGSQHVEPRLEGVRDRSDNWHVKVKSLEEFARQKRQAGSRIQY